MFTCIKIVISNEESVVVHYGEPTVMRRARERSRALQTETQKIKSTFDFDNSEPSSFSTNTSRTMQIQRLTRRVCTYVICNRNPRDIHSLTLLSLSHTPSSFSLPTLKSPGASENPNTALVLAAWWMFKWYLNMGERSGHLSATDDGAAEPSDGEPNETCNAMIRIERKGQHKWFVTKFVKEHSHSTSSSGEVHSLQPRRHFSSVGRTMPETYQGVGLVPSGVMYISMDRAPGNRNSTENIHGSRNFPAVGAKTNHQVSAVVTKTNHQVPAVAAKSNHQVPATSRSDTPPLLWPRHDETTRRFNLNDAGAPVQQSFGDLNFPRMAPVSVQRDDGQDENMLQDYTKVPSAETEVKFQLSRVSLEPMLKSMAGISEQLSTPANKVAVINLKLQDSDTISGESEVKFQVSRDTLGAMQRSMSYIREQLSSDGYVQSDPISVTKRQKK
ncbi:hypothetical protein Ahy_A07g031573 isoform B [Arachis hypogaea]|uniref:Uncharacterized protein n=1 Tax=Arachis hypogaea TaxID=3818 RepID=A0A445C4D3_ARAHY|nr:hypothetical protein Ahy_A07g031573 isoform B [Arachis hypogaea]